MTGDGGIPPLSSLQRSKKAKFIADVREFESFVASLSIKRSEEKKKVKRLQHLKCDSLLINTTVPFLDSSLICTIQQLFAQHYITNEILQCKYIAYKWLRE